MSNDSLISTTSQIVIYQTEVDGRLFQTTSQNITLHLKNIYDEEELSEAAICKDFLQVQIEGQREIKRNQKFYNLNAIISVGYRIKSHVATRFRQWATQRIGEYIGPVFGDVYRHT